MAVVGGDYPERWWVSKFSWVQPASRAWSANRAAASVILKPGPIGAPIGRLTPENLVEVERTLLAFLGLAPA